MRPRQPSDTQKPQTAKQQANDRLARALRDNLHRRKAQARARAAVPVTGSERAKLSNEESSSK